MNTGINMWEPVAAIVLAIFSTFLLFLMVYLLAFGIVKGGLFTFRKIKEEFNKQNKSDQNKIESLNINDNFPKRDDVIQNNRSNPWRNK